MVDRLKIEYEGVVEFRLANVEKDAAGAELATSLGAQYVPTFVFFTSDGVQHDMIVGEQTEEQLRMALDSLR